MIAVISILIACYMLATAISLMSSNRNVISCVSISVSLVGAVCTVLTAFKLMDSPEHIIEDGVIYLDSISLIFISLVSFVSVMALLYSHGYMQHELEEGAITDKDYRIYYVYVNLFVLIMYLTFMVQSLALIWVGVGATTLVSTFLVGFYRNDHSTEAAWKYMMLCSVGITIALIGITLVYASSVGVIDDANTAMDWTVLMHNAASLNPALLKMAMVLIIIGFGTKVGFSPMHTWLPDAHSQAPTPISGMLSAVLLNCALYAIIRFYMVSEITIPGFAKNILIIFGLLSLFTAACFIVIARDIKRMLAYSSIENMGLIAIGLGIGTELAIFGAIFQLIAHSVTKPLLFYSAGNIIQAYDTRVMSSITGLKYTMPFTAFMLTAGSLIIVGVPPFAIFVGEFNIILGAVSAGQPIIAIAVLALLAVVFAGFTMHIFPMISGKADQGIKEHEGIIRKMPFVIMILTTLVLGLFMPESLGDLLTDAARMIGGIL